MFLNSIFKDINTEIMKIALPHISSNQCWDQLFHFICILSKQNIWQTWLLFIYCFKFIKAFNKGVATTKMCNTLYFFINVNI